MPCVPLAPPVPPTRNHQKIAAHEYPLSPQLASSLRALLVTFAVLVYVAMAAYVGQASLLHASMDSNTQALWPWVTTWALIAGIAGLLTTSASAGWLQSKNVAATHLPPWVPYTRNLLLLLAFAPIAVLLTFTIAKALGQRPLVGPDPSSWFAQIRNEVSYGVP